LSHSFSLQLAFLPSQYFQLTMGLLGCYLIDVEASKCETFVILKK
jgi:hypothetical protein